MNKILVIASDTLHRRYLLNRLLDAGIPLLGCLFETQPAMPAYPTAPAFEDRERAFMQEHFFQDVRQDLDRLPCWYFPSANHHEALAKIDALQPDIALVSGAGLLRHEVLKRFPEGLINIHMGTAETYRGLDTNLWAIFHGEWNQIGVTVHWIEEALDTGPIIEQTRLPLHHGMQCHQLRYHETLLACEIILQAFSKLEDGTLKAYPQKQLGRYYTHMPRELRLFVEKRFNKHCDHLQAKETP